MKGGFVGDTKGWVRGRNERVASWDERKGVLCNRTPEPRDVFLPHTYPCLLGISNKTDQRPGFKAVWVMLLGLLYPHSLN